MQKYYKVPAVFIGMYVRFQKSYQHLGPPPICAHGHVIICTALYFPTSGVARGGQGPGPLGRCLFWKKI